MTDQPLGESTKQTRLRAAIWASVAAAIVIDVAVQILWKQCVAGVPDSYSMVQTLVHTATRPLTAVLAVSMVAQFANWSWLLSRADLSFVQPLTALAYPLTAALAWAAFGEHISPLRAGGLLLVIVGVWLIGGTAPSTTPKEGA